MRSAHPQGLWISSPEESPQSSDRQSRGEPFANGLRTAYVRRAWSARLCLTDGLSAILTPHNGFGAQEAAGWYGGTN
jgi:hypothetical protein